MIIVDDFKGNLQQLIDQTTSLPGGSSCKEYHLKCSRPRFNPWVGRSPEERNGYPLWYSCRGKPMDRGAWWATVSGVTKSQTQLSE